MNPKIILIHPQDSSTSFLGAIISFLESEKFLVEVFKPGYQTDNLIAEIEDCYKEGDILVFLGHGSSRALYGSANERQEQTILFNLDQTAQFFSKKKNILLACRSAELLTTATPKGEYIGFGDLPTSLDEVLGARDQADPFYLKGLEEETLVLFQNVLIKMMTDAFRLSKEKYSLRTFYIAMRYSLNRALTQIATSKTIVLKQRQLLFQIIQETKIEMIHR